MQFIPTITEPVRAKNAGQKRSPWSPRELQVLRERYIAEGVVACERLLPDRARCTIMQKASEMGLRRQRRHQDPQQTTEMLDAAIRRFYLEPRRSGAMREFAKRYGRSRHWIYYRARQLGVINTRHERRNWTEAEDDILREFAEKRVEYIARRLKREGYTRSPGAIGARLRAIGYSADARADPDVYTAAQLARVMGVDSHVPIRWITGCGLKAKRTGSGRTAGYAIHRRDLRAWLVASAEWDHRRCPRWWLVDILAGATSSGNERAGRAA